MSETRHFIVNFTSALKMLGEMPEGGTLELRPGTGAFATGMPFAGENYALFDSCSLKNEVFQILHFFTERKLPYISMQLPKLKNEISEALESNGLSIKTDYLAMSLGTSISRRKSSPQVKTISEKSDERKWAEAAWAGFDGALPVPENYNNFTAYLNSRPENHLYFLEKDGVPVCSALLHSTSETCGLYYFATKPEVRRQGMAVKLMDFLVEQAALHSEHLVLLATQMGAKMYKSYGFKPLLRVPVFSESNEL